MEAEKPDIEVSRQIEAAVKNAKARSASSEELTLQRGQHVAATGMTIENEDRFSISLIGAEVVLFEDCTLRNMAIVGDISHFIFKNCELDQVSVVRGSSQFHGCNVLGFSGIVKNSVINTGFKGGTLSIADSRLDAISGSTFIDVDFLSAWKARSIDKTHFSGGKVLLNLNNAKLNEVTFRDLEFLSETNFKDCSFKDCKMSRASFFTLHDRGGLTVHNLADIEIFDPFTEIRQNFTGLNRWLNWFAIIWFLTPYAAFVAWRWGEHLAKPEVKDATLLSQLVNYIGSGGQTYTEWQPSPYSIAIFAVFTIYNVCRFLLLRQVQDIEVREKLQGFPVIIKTDNARWFWSTAVVKWGFYISLVLAALNTLNFALTKVPN